MRKTLLAAVCVLVMTAFVYPRPPMLNKANRFKHIGLREGLTQNSVNCIFQDSHGFMWFGTQEGLNRFDGSQFKAYFHNPEDPDSLLNSGISAICESPVKPGSLWIGTWDGLCRFDSESQTFTSAMNNPADIWRKIKNCRIETILEDKKGHLWIGVRNEGVFQVDIRTETIVKHYKNTPMEPDLLISNSVYALTMDGVGNIWMGFDRGGLCRLNPESGTFSWFQPSPDDLPPELLNENLINHLLYDSDGDLWIGTDGGGLIRMSATENGGFEFSCFLSKSAGSGDSHFLDDNIIFSLLEDKSGLLWIGTRSSGLSSFNKKTGHFLTYSYTPGNPNSLNNNTISCIFEDDAGSLWVGTIGGGINVLNPHYDNFLLYKPGSEGPHNLKHNNIWSIAESRDGKLWVGTDGGLYRFDLDSGDFYHIVHDAGNPLSLPHNRISNIFFDSRGGMWLGSDGGGLYHCNKEADRCRHYRNDPKDPQSLTDDYVESIFEDRDGVLWVGTRRGIGCLKRGNGDEGAFTRYIHDPLKPGSLSSGNVFSITQDIHGTIWITVFGGGLDRFHPETGTFSHFRHDTSNPQSLCGNRVISIFCDEQGVLWLGTSNGLDRFELETGQWTHYNTRHGLPNNVIYSILEQAPSPEDSNRYLWVSTNRGLSRFNPETGEFKNYDISDGLQSNEFNKGAALKTSGGLMFFGGIEGFNVFDPHQLKDNSFIPPVVLTDFKLFHKTVPIKEDGTSPLSRSISHTEEIRLNHRQDSFSFDFAALNYISPEKNRYAYKLENFDDKWIDLEGHRSAFYTRVPPGKYVFRVRGSNNEGLWNVTGASVRVIVTPPFWLTVWFRILAVVVFLLVILVFHKRRTNRIKQRMERRQLEKELKMKADFTAMLVHDLRSPLNAIQGYCELMEDAGDKKTITRGVEVISLSSGKMLRLINDMLDLSRFEAGKMNLDREDIRMAIVVEETARLLDPLLEKKQLVLNIKWERGLKSLPVSLDPIKIGQVVNNLLTNAVKFSPVGGTITVNIQRVEGNNYMELAVTDNGPGVPPEEREFLFDKYAQLHKDRKVKGTGLGLAVSKVIIEAHGGVIDYRPLKDKNGTGSTFYFRLPIQIDESR